jgi:cell division protein ZapB
MTGFPGFYDEPRKKRCPDINMEGTDIDPCRGPLYSRAMADMQLQGITEQDLHALEVRVEELIRACSHLNAENRALRDREQGLLSERASLIEKNELARTRVEAMISRLKSLEASSQ